MNMPRAENTTGEMFPKGTCPVLCLLSLCASNVFRKIQLGLCIPSHLLPSFSIQDFLKTRRKKRGKKKMKWNCLPHCTYHWRADCSCAHSLCVRCLLFSLSSGLSEVLFYALERKASETSVSFNKLQIQYMKYLF